MLSGLIDPVEPPKRVRQRLMASIGASKTKRRWMFALPVLATACAALLVLSIWSGFELIRARHDLDVISSERRQLKEALAVLSASQPQMVGFHPERGPQGSVFVNRSGGFVITGSQMPPIAENKAFELWLIPKSGSPIPAGVFQPMQSNTFVHVYREPVQTNQIAAVAVTVEPKEGSLAPTSKPFLVVPLS
jgi:hypothetical protein